MEHPFGALPTSVCLLAGRPWNQRPFPALLAVFGLLLLSAEAEAQCQSMQYTATARTVGGAVSEIAAGDIDDDGDWDVLTVDGSSIHVLLNHGVLGFAQQSFDPGVASSVLTLGDLDSDGDLDLLVGFDNGMLWLANDGAGHFAAVRTILFPAGDGQPIAAKLGDVNEDGLLDVVFGLNMHPIGGGATSGALWVALGDGAGGLQPLPTNALALRAVDIVLADFDGDGHLDVAELGGYVSASTVSIANGLGDGTFVTALPSIPVGIYAGGLACGDFDGDGDIDLATGFKYYVSIRMNDGAAHFTLTQSLGAGSYVKGIAAGDLERDGDLDLLVTSGSASAIRLASNDSSGHFSVTASVPASVQCYSVLLADTSGDGYLDAWAGDVVTGGLYSAVSDCIVGTASYCTPKVSSLGCSPAIGWTGIPSATAGSGFIVNATRMINNKACLLIYGVSGRAALPFQGGTLCVNPPVRRAVSTSTAGNPPPNDCSGAPLIDMNRFATGGLGGSPLAALTSVGTTVVCQWWGRDPGFVPPSNSQLSNALEYTVGQ